MQDRIRRMKSEEGFTLIELLIVIIILGILAAIVVFAVGGITDRGQLSACATDLRTLRTAEEANKASKFDTYTTEANLVANGFLAQESSWHDVSASSKASYTLALQAGSPCPPL